MRRRILILSLFTAAACGDRPMERAPARTAPVATAPAPSWRVNPDGAGLVAGDSSMIITTGPHVVAWDPAAAPLAPPYTLRATLHKRTGRLHEGIGLIFGGSGLEGAESTQAYSYFLVRGDGSFLIKRRQGAETPIVRDWTPHPVIRRDADGSGRPNDLEVAVADSVVTFRINGTEVARVPASELSVRGAAGVRAAHDVELEVTGFHAGGRP
jgi:hypothetical protein